MKTSVCLATLTLAGIALTGCSQKLTPELAGAANTHEQTTTNYEVTANMNWRGLSDDFNRSFYTDNPSRLSPFPIVSTNGNPR